MEFGQAVDMIDREQIVKVARTWLGTPYLHQASLKGVGCDCLGLVRGVYAEVCGRPAEDPPPYSRDWAEAAHRETMIEAASRHLTAATLDQIALGDVLIFRLRHGAMAKHVAIVSDCGFDPASASAACRVTIGQVADRPFSMIHAVEGAPVCEVHVSPWWRRRIAAAFRFPT